MIALIARSIVEGLILSAFLVSVCAVGIRKGTVGMAAISAAPAGIMTIFIH